MKQNCIIVLGMHRSGTSAMAGICAKLGAYAGENLLAGSVENERGFWENNDIIAAHDTMFERQNSAWDSPQLLEHSPDFSPVSSIVDGIFGDYPLWLIKDPRMCRFMPQWLALLAQKNVSPHIIIMVRSPASVAASLVKRDGFSEEKSLTLWLLHMLEAERNTRSANRIFIDYDDLLEQSERVFNKVSSALSLGWDYTQNQAAIKSFLTKTLRHEQQQKVNSSNIHLQSLIASCAEIFASLCKSGETPELLAGLDAQYAKLSVWLKQSFADAPFSSADMAQYSRKSRKLSHTLHEKNLELRDAGEQIAQKHNELVALQSDYRWLTKKQQDLEIKANGLNTTIGQLQEEIQQMKATVSWKITKPLRLARRIIQSRHAFLSLKVYKRFYQIYQQQGLRGLKARLGIRFGESDNRVTLSSWFGAYQPSPRNIAVMLAQHWPQNAPKITVLMCVYNGEVAWLNDAIASVQKQTYPFWELLLVNDCSSVLEIAPLLDAAAQKEKRIRVIHLPENKGVSTASNIGIAEAKGDYICFMDHDDVIEPQALQRFAEAILQADADILYSDEAITSVSTEDIQHLVLRPQFSYDYYISHPYFVHFIAIRTAILRNIGGFDTSFRVSQDYDLVLRAIEKAKRITHIPEVLYRWRTNPNSLGHAKFSEVTDASRRALKNHLARIGFADAIVSEGRSYNFYDVDFNIPTEANVAIIIPSKNRADLLSKCVESLEKTIPSVSHDIYVIDHDSDDGEAIALLKEIAKKHTVLPYSGEFNFSTIINFGVASLPKPYTHYLILNNDIEAIESGWLEKMVATAKRSDVGIVGCTLLYPNRKIQHAGVLMGIYGAAEHAHKGEDFMIGGSYALGFNGDLQSNRDYLAVTAACLLIKADVYSKIGGFDETLKVGFGDTDLCLRVIEAGQKVILDARAVLIHHESMTRGKSESFVDPHPEDSLRFITRYAHIMRDGDPYYNPMLSRNSPNYQLSADNYFKQQISFRTCEIRLPAA